MLVALSKVHIPDIKEFPFAKIIRGAKKLCKITSGFICKTLTI